MNHIEYFKLQAKNLFRDYKTQYKLPYQMLEDPVIYGYNSKFFDIAQIAFDFNINEEGNFTLMNAQHIVACILGFHKWTDITKASTSELELAKLLFDNQHKIDFFEWEEYIKGIESNKGIELDTEEKLKAFHELSFDKP